MSKKHKTSSAIIKVGSITKGVLKNVQAGRTVRKPNVSLKPSNTVSKK